MKKLTHSNIIQLHSFCYLTNDKIALILEYGIGGTLADHLKNKGKLKESWGKLTDDDLKIYEGNRDQFLGKIKERYGIEKEDRLAKVSKVASFMYGRNEVNIIDADALISHENIKPESFDVLVANPPFAVEDFLQTIDEVEREKFKLFNLVNNPSNNNIQCFFLERAQQLLAPDSVMGVIVPSSILSNSDSIHIATREILLQHFDFLSIVELGSQTFGKTGTNTVVLFLRRKAQRPEQAVQFRNRVNNFFADWENEKSSGGGAYQDIKVVETIKEGNTIYKR